MCQIKKGICCMFMAALGVAIGLGLSLFLLSRSQQSKEIVIDSFNSGDATKRIEFGAKNLNQLFVESSSKSSTPFGHSIKMRLKLMPDSYNFIASGQGLADKNFDWENRPKDINWDDIIGVSYKVFVEDIKGAPVKVDLVRLATDVIDGDGEILRNRTIVHTGEWVNVRVYFQDVLSRSDYQRDWKSVKRVHIGDNDVPTNKVDNGLKSYQIEVLGLVSDPAVDIKKINVEVDMYVDDVALIHR